MRAALTIPNALTVSRLVATPFLCHAVLNHDVPVALGLLSYAAATDVLDGWVARRWNMQSALGSYLDPLADKVLVTAGAVSLAAAGLLPIPLVGLILVRDGTLAQGTAWHVWRTTGSFRLPVSLEASQLSKGNTMLQIVLFFSALLDVSRLTGMMIPLVAATTWFSGFQYYLSNPLKDLPSRPQVSPQQQRFGQGVNTVFVSVGFGLFAWTVYGSLAAADELGEAGERNVAMEKQ